MSFFEIVEKYKGFDFQGYIDQLNNDKIRKTISKNRLSDLDFLTLLSDKATPFVEDMAQNAYALTRRHFGNIVYIFTPLYISNYCQNVCAYCSFARHHKIIRKHLNVDEIRNEAEAISQSGIRHILVLTGESRVHAQVDYLVAAVKALKDYFSSIALEVYPLKQDEYAQLVDAGIDTLTIYQETYNSDLYTTLHKGGPKEDYRFRLEAPERAANAGVRAVTVGALFGLHNPLIEAFLTGLHASYLQRTYPGLEVAVSFPRLRPQAGDFTTGYSMSDVQFVQYMSAMRIFLPSSGFTVSTRESKEFRNHVLPISVTKMSAGVSTAVGGHSDQPSTTQFEIADDRSVDEIKDDLLNMGYQAVMHDWNGDLVRKAV